MRVMVIVKGTADSEAGTMPSPELLDAMVRFNQELAEAGLMLAGEGLHPTGRGLRVRFDGPGREVVQGPFAPAGEQIAGFWLWRVKDIEEALAWVRLCPNPMPGPSELEIRQVFEAEEFGEALSPELAAREEQLRRRLAKANAAGGG